MKQNTTKLIGADIFSGAGGMSWGAEQTGISIIQAVEKYHHFADTYKANHPHTKVIQDDIRNVDFKDLRKKDLFVLFGGPPCQGFSTSNTRTRNLSNTNNSLFEEFLRAVSESYPKWVVFENVEGFSFFKDGDIMRELEARLSKLGYTTKATVLTASDYGVPQNRNRFFLVANRLGVEYSFPKKYAKKVSVAEAIFDLPELPNGASFPELPYKTNIVNTYTKKLRKGCKIAYQNFVSKNQDYVVERYQYIKPGQNWKAIPQHLMANYKETQNCHSGIYKRLKPNEPSVVISNYRKNMLIHPIQNRGLSVREAARLQSFPDNFIFKGPLSHIQQQIGNAVPPLLAYAVFKSIIDQYKKWQKKSHV